MAEIKIQDLLQSIRDDGIKKAQTEADALISEAQKKASTIVDDAKAEANSIKLKTQSDCDTFKKQAEDSIAQACSNALLSLKKEFEDIIAKVVNKNLSSQLSGDGLITLVKEAIKERGNSNVILELSSKTVDFARAKLVEELNSGLEIKLNDSIRSGFRLKEKDGSGYYDFSADELTEIIKPYLSSSLRKVIEK